MSSLSLEIEDSSGHALTDKTYHILRDFLQQDSRLTIEDAAQAVLTLLPENAPLSTEVWEIGEICIELAKQVPYYHPSQLKLAELFEKLGKSTKFGSRHASKATTYPRASAIHKHRLPLKIRRVQIQVTILDTSV